MAVLQLTANVDGTVIDGLERDTPPFELFMEVVSNVMLLPLKIATRPSPVAEINSCAVTVPERLEIPTLCPPSIPLPVTATTETFPPLEPILTPPVGEEIVPVAVIAPLEIMLT